MRKLTILGATGSIGRSTLAVIENNATAYEVFALSADTNVELMCKLCIKWRPAFAAMANEKAAQALRVVLKEYDVDTKVLSGIDGICQLAAHEEADTVMAAIVGSAGLKPTLSAIKAGKRVLLANKEALVMSGQFFIDAVEQYGAQLLPVDSEHNAIYQCLPKEVQQQIGQCSLTKAGVSKILLTGSGGPFRYHEIAALEKVSLEEAIAHPNWSMGPKISVDSATMMNKGLEYIEARWLFNATQAQLDVIIHPQSIIHSMVQYCDGSVLAQMGQPDMRTPIAYAMSYPNRIASGVKPLDFTKMGELSFIKPDYQRYPCLKLAMTACFEGQAATTVLNAANEEAVAAFLAKRIGFMQIAQINDALLQQCHFSTPECIDTLLEIDKKARSMANDWIKRLE